MFFVNLVTCASSDSEIASYSSHEADYTPSVRYIYGIVEDVIANIVIAQRLDDFMKSCF